MALTHDGGSFMRPQPVGIPLFDDPGMEGVFALVMKVRDGESKVIGFASELEAPQEGRTTEGLAIMNTGWTVVIPGRGTIYLHEMEDNRDLIIDIAGPVLAGGQDWSGKHTMVSTIGPHADGRGIVMGGSGEFENIRGSFVELHHLTGFTAKGGLQGKAELRLFIVE